MKKNILQKLAIQGLLTGALALGACGEESPQRKHVSASAIKAAQDKTAQYKSDCEAEGKIAQIAPSCHGNNACAGLNPDGSEHSCQGQNTCGGAVSCVNQDGIDKHKASKEKK